ncbi:MAG: hypothetical protein GKC10_07350 [Methanosarcinales archaeon]|nr:hypothetical protein [Methanosarcinales archaeon]
MALTLGASLGAVQNATLSPTPNVVYTLAVDVPDNCTLDNSKQPEILQAGMLFGSGMLQSAEVTCADAPGQVASVDLIWIKDGTKAEDVITGLISQLEENLYEMRNFKVIGSKQQTIDGYEATIKHYLVYSDAGYTDVYSGGFKVRDDLVVYLYSNLPGDRTDQIFGSLDLEPAPAQV